MPFFSPLSLNWSVHYLSHMPFAGKVWIGLLLRCIHKAGCGIGSQARDPGKTISLPSWGRYFRIGEAGFPVFSQGADKKKPRAVTERIQLGPSRRPCFYVQAPSDTETPAWPEGACTGGDRLSDRWKILSKSDVQQPVCRRTTWKAQCFSPSLPSHASPHCANLWS
jgi:hypothetical protein